MTKTLLQAKVVDIEKRRYPSKHYVYVIDVSWSEGTQTKIYRRYSAFFEFQCGLLEKYPVEAGAKNPADRCIPFLPGKKIFGRSHVRTVAEKRMGPINEYCQTLIRLPPNISDGEYVKNFFEVTPEDINPPTKKEKKKSVETANEISDPVLLEQFTAVADYKKQKNTECDLTEGQIVEVIDKNENGWWFVHLDDLNEGWVPATYLESVYGRNNSTSPIVLNPGEEETFITTSSYTAKNSDELTFEKGVLVEVFQKGLDGWWKGRYQNKEGYIPACYLFRYYGPMGSSEGIEMVSTAQDAVDSMQRTSSSAGGSRVKSPRPGHTKQHPLKGTINIAGIKLKRGVDPFADEPIYAPTPRKETVQTQKSSVRPPVVSRLPVFSSSSSFESDESDENYAKPDVLFGKKNSESEFEDDSIHDYETLSEHYLTIADFQAQVSDGLSFNEGEEVSVITKNPSGWWFVEAGNNEGWVPSSYLEKIHKPHGANKQNMTESVKPKAKPSLPVRKDINKTSPEIVTSKPHEEKDSFKPKAKPLPPVRKDLNGAVGGKQPAVSNFTAKQSDNTAKPKVKPPPPQRKDIGSFVMPKADGDDGTCIGQPKSPPISNKPKPSVAKKPSVGHRISNEGDSSVAAMAALLSQGINKPVVNRRSSTEDGNQEVRHPSVSKKPFVPHREPIRPPSYEANKRDSLRRSSSSDSIREVERPPDTRLSKSPYPGRPLNKQLSDTKPVKFLRNSTENLLAAQTEEENRLSVAPKPVPRKSFASSKDQSPTAPRRTITVSNPASVQSKPAPPSRNHIPPSNNQTLRLAGLEKALKSKKSPPVRPVKKTVSATTAAKKPSPPKRPNSSPNKAKKTPPPRPSNSPAGSRKITYVTIGDYCGYDDSSLSFNEGENVKVLEKNSEGWWYVEIGGKEGWVPSTFIEMTSAKPERPSLPVKKPTPVSRPKPTPPVRKDNMYRAVADYTTPVYEDSGVNLVEDGIYEVLEKSDGGWWFVKIGDQEGWAPSSFLEPV